MRLRSTYFYFGCAFILMIILCNTIIKTQVKDQLYNETEAIPHRSHALVLGTSKMGKHGINPYFRYRMEAAAALYFSGKVDTLIVSGDNHIATYNETEDMRNYLIELGVPKERIIEDFAGFRTLDSVVRAKAVFHCKSLTIISQQFHNERALYIANHIGLDAVAFNAHDTNSSINFTHLREWVARCLVVADLHLLRTQPKFL